MYARADMRSVLVEASRTHMQLLRQPARKKKTVIDSEYIFK